MHDFARLLFFLADRIDCVLRASELWKFFSELDFLAVACEIEDLLVRGPLVLQLGLLIVHAHVNENDRSEPFLQLCVSELLQPLVIFRIVKNDLSSRSRLIFNVFHVRSLYCNLCLK